MSASLNLSVNGLPDLLLHEVCALGDTVKLEELGNFVRKRKLDVNMRDDECGDRVAMHWAASRGNATPDQFRVIVFKTNNYCSSNPRPLKLMALRSNHTHDHQNKHRNTHMILTLHRNESV